MQKYFTRAELYLCYAWSFSEG